MITGVKMKTPSKHMSLKRIDQILIDHNIGAGGQEYSEEELLDLRAIKINDQANKESNKLIKLFIKNNEKQDKFSEVKKKSSELFSLVNNLYLSSLDDSGYSYCNKTSTIFFHTKSIVDFLKNSDSTNDKGQL